MAQPGTEEAIKTRLISRLTADSFLGVDSTTPRVRTLIEKRGVAFARDALQQLDQEDLSGVAASLKLDELAGMTREQAEHRLAKHLSLKIGKRNGRRESADAIELRARSLARMREAGLTWLEILATFERLSADRSLLAELLAPSGLLHHWRKESEAQRSTATVAAL
jgi:hypothetical protein